MSGSDSEGDSDRRKGKATALDQQRAKLKKLMDHPVRHRARLCMTPSLNRYYSNNTLALYVCQEKPALIPDRPKDWKPQQPPEFVRFYMGTLDPA